MDLTRPDFWITVRFILMSCPGHRQESAPGLNVAIRTDIALCACAIEGGMGWDEGPSIPTGDGWAQTAQNFYFYILLYFSQPVKAPNRVQIN
jgi:hypothetical protein